MPPELKPQTEPVNPGLDAEYWQNLDQWLDTPQFREMMKNEFPEDAPEWLDPVSRRQFVTTMGASIALAAAGCNPSLKPASAKKVVPYVNQPAQIVPGVPLFFASTCPQPGGTGLGIIVKSVEGRPIKVEGNPNHPSSLGGTDIATPASILSMYEPNRSKSCTYRQQPATFEKIATFIKDELAKQADKKGAGVRILSGVTTSPTLGAQLEVFLKEVAPAAKWIQYEPAHADNAKRAAFAAFGKYVNPVYNLGKAKVALALDSDFLSATGPGGVRYAREFMANRKVRTVEAALKAGDGVKLDDMNRLYAVEGMLTNTGATADHRLPLKPSEVEAFAQALAKELGITVPNVGELPQLAKDWVTPLKDDLLKNKGAAVVLVGDHQPPAVHLLALAINEKLGAFGSTVTFIDPVENRPTEVAESAKHFKELCDDMKADKVSLLLILESNPVYDAPVDFEFDKLLAKVKLSVHFSNSVDETAKATTAHINAAHYLECWGDSRAHDGTVSLQQVLMAPLGNGKSVLELFAQLVNKGANDPYSAGDSYEIVKAHWKKHFDEKIKSGSFEDFWQKAVKDGMIAGTTFQPVAVSAVKVDALNDKNFATPVLPKGKMEIQFRPDPTVYDGRYAENGWLQELPKPITKLTWDNALIVSPATAEKLGVGISFAWTGGEHGNSEADMVELNVEGKKVEAAVWILHGHADDCATLHLGYGRTQGAANGVNKGFNAYKVRNSGGLYTASINEVKKTNAKYTLSCTQGQHAMESRKPVRHATVAEYKKDPVFAQIPAASPGEYKEIRALTPGTPEDFVRLEEASKKRAGTYENKEEKHEKNHDHRVIPLSLYPDNPTQVKGDQSSASYRRWSMTVDLGACTGCTACVIACVTENNIPVVGKAQVNKGRAMHWIRIDRYFSIPGEHNQDDKLGGKDVKTKDRAEMAKKSAQIRAHFQPVMCQHCEKAPCEVVCPVGATVHSADGLNDMAYNRCVGTRYCSNNCPYKVRRFNFLQYTSYDKNSLSLLNNPEVTVRTRGVMEKCTYCTQRIRNAEIEAEREHAKRPKDKNGRPKIMDGEIITACQSACPTGAISFGDLNDADSAVLRTKAEPTNYGLLAELNTMPRTSYLAAIRNPNPAMPGLTKGGA